MKYWHFGRVTVFQTNDPEPFEMAMIYAILTGQYQEAVL